MKNVDLSPQTEESIGQAERICHEVASRYENSSFTRHGDTELLIRRIIAFYDSSIAACHAVHGERRTKNLSLQGGRSAYKDFYFMESPFVVSLINKPLTFRESKGGKTLHARM